MNKNDRVGKREAGRMEGGVSMIVLVRQRRVEAEGGDLRGMHGRGLGGEMTDVGRGRGVESVEARLRSFRRGWLGLEGQSRFYTCRVVVVLSAR